MRRRAGRALSIAFALAVALGVVVWIRTASAAPKRTAPGDAVARVLSAFEELDRARLETAICLDVWSPRELLDAMESFAACEATIEEGDSSFGTVHVIGQIHESPDASSAVEREALAVYQATILRHLMRHDARVLFVEGWPADSEIVRPSPVTEAMLRETLRDLPGPESLLVRGTERQIELLQTSTAVHAAYRALRPEVTVLGADTTFRIPRRDFLAQDSLTFEARERVAMGAVIRHLSRHPGSRVFLVYGAAHLFDRQSLPAGSRVPRMTMTTFPALIARHPEFQDRVARLLGGDAALVERFVNLLEGIAPGTFAAVPEAVQRACLKRPFYLDGDAPTGDALEAWLLEHAKSEEVRRLVKTAELRYFEL